MALQSFINGEPPVIGATWLNAVDVLLTTVFQGATTAALARTAIGVQRNNCVTMQRNSANTAWEVLDEDGANISVVGSTSEGLQEAIDYAWLNGIGLVVRGAGVTYPGASYEGCEIVATETITFPASTQNWVRAEGVFLVCNPNPATPGIIFDSADSLDFEWSGFILYTGGNGGAVPAISIAPTLPNTELFTGWTSSRLSIRSIVIVGAAPTYLVKDSEGVGLRFSTADSVAIVNNVIDIGEINGGLVGIQVDNPNAGKLFKYNVISSPAIHQNGSCAVVVGTSASADNLIFGNRWYLTLNDGAGSALSTFSENDIYDLTISNFPTGTGITLGSTAIGNIFRVAKNNASIPVTDNSTVKSSVGMYGGPLGQIVNTLSGDVACNNTANYFTGPTCANPTQGIWFASGSVVVRDTAGAAVFHVKLWDGTTVIASTIVNTTAINLYETVHLSGYITTPGGNIRISVKDATSTSGVIIFNGSGESKDSTLTVFRIN